MSIETQVCCIKYVSADKSSLSGEEGKDTTEYCVGMMCDWSGISCVVIWANTKRMLRLFLDHHCPNFHVMFWCLPSLVEFLLDYESALFRSRREVL